MKNEDEDEDEDEGGDGDEDEDVLLPGVEDGAADVVVVAPAGVHLPGLGVQWLVMDILMVRGLERFCKTTTIFRG